MPETWNRYPPCSLICMWSSSLVPVWSWGLTPESLVLLVGKASPREVTWVLRPWTPHGNNWHRSGVQGMVPWAWRLRREEAVGGAEGWEWGWGWRWAWQFPDPKVSPVNSGFKSKELCPWAICCGDLAVGREKMTVLLTFDFLLTQERTGIRVEY